MAENKWVTGVITPFITCRGPTLYIYIIYLKHQTSGGMTGCLGFVVPKRILSSCFFFGGGKEDQPRIHQVILKKSKLVGFFKHMIHMMYIPNTQCMVYSPIHLTPKLPSFVGK